jgi:bacterioferritin-associated ferredoxin
MGELHQRRDRMDDAVEWTLRAIDHSEGLGETVALASGYQQLGELRAAQGNRAACEACFDRAEEILERNGLSERLAECTGRRHRALQAPAATARPAG